MYTQDESGQVVREDGMVAMHYVITQNSKRVILKGNGHDYFFSSQHHVNLAWVYPEDVPTLLSIREKSCKCNNGTMKQAFQLATLVNVNIYHTGNM